MSGTNSTQTSDWRDSRHRSSPMLSRSMKLSVFWGALILLLVCMTYLLYVVLFPTVERTFLVTVATEASDLDESVCLPVEFQDATRELLLTLPRFSTSFPDFYTGEDSSETVSISLEKRTDSDELGDLVARLFDEHGPKSFFMSEQRVLLVYVCAQGIAVDQRPYLLAGNFSGTYNTDSKGQNRGLCDVRDLLDQLAGVDADVKLLLVDTGRLPPSPRLGLMLNDFPRVLGHTVAEYPDDRLWVFCSNLSGQEAGLDYAQRSTRFGSAVFEALRGDADQEKHGGNADHRVSLNELYGFVRTYCAPNQTPFLVRGNTSAKATDREQHMEVRPTRPIPLNLCLVSIKPDAEEDSTPSYAEKLLAKGARRATSKYTSRAKQTTGKAKRINRKAQRIAGSDGTSQTPAESADAADAAQPRKSSKPAADQSSSTRATTDDSLTDSQLTDNDARDRSGGNDFELLGKAWDVRDSLARSDGVSAPVIMPQLWRRLEFRLIELEHRMRFGSRQEHDQARVQLEGLVADLELIAPESEVRQVPGRLAGESLLGQRIVATWLQFDEEKFSPAYGRYTSVKDDEIAEAMLNYQLALYRAVDYVRWHDLSCRSSAKQSPYYDDTHGLLKCLGGMREILESVSDGWDADELMRRAEDLFLARRSLDDKLKDEVERAGAIAPSRAEHLLSLPLLQRSERLALLRQIDNLSVSDGHASGSRPSNGNKRRNTEWFFPRQPTGFRLLRLVDSLTLHAELMRVFSKEDVSLNSFVNEISPSRNRLTESLYATEKAEQILSRFYEAIPTKLQNDRENRRSEDAKSLLRLVSAHDVVVIESGADAWLGEIALLPVPSIASAKPEVVNVQLHPNQEQFVFNGTDVATELQVQFTASRYHSQPLLVDFRTSSDNITVASPAEESDFAGPAATQIPVQFENSEGSVTIALTAKAWRSEESDTVRLTCHAAGAGNGRTVHLEPSVFTLKLPAEDDVELGGRQDGTAIGEYNSSTDDILTIHPCPNRDNTFEFFLRNTSEKPRTVDVELFAVKRPKSGATWPTGFIVPGAKTELGAELFQGGDFAVQPGVEPLMSATVELTDDGKEWQPIRFGVEQPPAEKPQEPAETANAGDTGSSTEMPPASELVNISHGLVCRIADADPQAKEWVKVKWISIEPWQPEDYLQYLTVAAYSSVRNSQVAVELSLESDLGPKPQWPRQVPGLDEDPLDFRLRPIGELRLQEKLAGTLFGEINNSNKATIVNFVVPGDFDVPVEKSRCQIALNVDGWPRAFFFPVEFEAKGASSHSDQLRLDEITTTTKLVITQISTKKKAADDEQWIYKFDAANERVPSVRGEEEQKSHVKFVQSSDQMLFFPGRYAKGERLVLDFQVDVPKGRSPFRASDDGDKIVVQARLANGDTRRLAGPFYADRQMSTTLKEDEAGGLVVHSQVSDYSVPLSRILTVNSPVIFGAALYLNGEEYISDVVQIQMDDSPPQPVSIPAVVKVVRATDEGPKAVTERAIILKDESGIGQVTCEFGRPGVAADKAMQVPNDMIKPMTEDTQYAVTIPLDIAKDVEPGEYELRVSAVDAVGNQRKLDAIRVVVEDAAPPPSKNLTIEGLVRTKGKRKIPDEPATVKLSRNGEQVGEEILTDKDGWFRFQNLQDGTYTIEAVCVHNYRTMNGTKSNIPAQENWEQPVMLEVASY